MKPETVLRLKYGEDPKAVLNKWTEEYEKIAKEFPAAEAMANELLKRAQKACKLIVERKKAEPASASRDDMYYIEIAKIRDAEDASLDGDFPLGNEEDGVFAGCYFSIFELAEIQCALHDRISVGDFNGYNFDVLVRKGFIAELKGDFSEAARCYEGVSTSESVQEREYKCRRKMADSGDPDAFWQMAQLCKEQNDNEGAARWFNKAIEAGQADALISAAAVYLDENGGFYNQKLAKQYLCRAADGGSVKAIIALADLELTDTDIPFWQQAAQLSDLEHPEKKPKRKIREQHKKQMAWYCLAAKAGDSNAMNALSMAYHLGYPEKRDDEQAFLWACRGADQNDGSAMYQAAYFYENGIGTQRDIDAAMLLYTNAAEKGVRSAMIRLYEIYTKGLGNIKPDGQKAARYLWLSGEGRD